MKLLYVLAVVIALPLGAFAESDAYHIKPFVGYNLSLASSHNLKIKNNAGTLAKSENFEFNDNNVGGFVLGVEIDDIVAISINPSLSKSRVEYPSFYTNTTKMNEINAIIEIHLMRNSNFKPYVSLSAGYVSMDSLAKASGAIFSFGCGAKQYMTNNFYLNTNLSYNTTTKMSVKDVNGNLQMSGFDLIIGAGYRF